MLGVKTYEVDYVEQCRARFDALLGAYGTVSAENHAGNQTFEPAFLEILVVALEACFVHRLRGVEGKDGNPLNELRMLSDSILQHEGVLTANPSIKYDAAASVVGLSLGEKIRLDRPGFERLAGRVFEEIRRRFTDAT